MSIRVEGADKFVSAMTNKRQLLPERAKRLVQTTAASTQQQAARLAPVKTGFLKRSTNINVVSTSTTAVGTVTANAYNKNFNYGYAQENGTRFIKPKLFMYQAFMAHKNVFISNLEAILNG
ncbi:HK97 gp10 family phage protein [Eupransor demetentiae]|uniref:HK97 gp10 family phage protein n=1 Tax=Eupransor demetentiae TaxID=3109584 RepID=A0ABM9N4N1_9LACO|nr:hypothetical protein R54876_GBNLAHCA_00680 [Lactobacillaceae bacterium LMG 33000]